MIQINLLPWRDRRRQQRQKQFFVLLGGAVAVGGLLVLAAFAFMNAKIDNQNSRNQMLQSEIQILDRQIARIRDLDQQRQMLIDRIEVIQTLQASRPEAVHLFDQLVLSMPPGMYFRELRREGDRLRVAGHAESNARISALMRRVDASPWLSDSTLQIIETRQDGALQIRDFRVEARQVRPAAAPEEGEGS
ncbi:MAG TPA: PilN domain-containing protein [Thioalkalivibrio sp.]|nr:PilN domain-containing protein [Thioalkalivibrio sp.]